jgi:glycosyltransferase involved in cell wall biosynthesis
MVEKPQRFYRKILVVTDSFPPDVAGGAELSLYSAMREMSYHDTTTVVVALSGHVKHTTVSRVDGFKVYRIPFHEEWPSFTREPKRMSRYRAFVSELVRSGSDCLRFLKAVGVNVLMHKRYKGALGIYPLMDRFYLMHSQARQELMQIVEKEQPDLIHADNYRSIVLAADFHDSYPSMSLVRDNRFYCTHRNQATNIKGVVCQTCSFGCTEGKATPLVEKLVRGLMKDTLQIRRNALLTSDAVAVTSDFLFKQIAQVVPSEKIHVLPNVTESPSVVDAWAGRSLLPPKKRILCVGMIGHNKGQNSLLNAFKRVVETHPDSELVFAGRGVMVNRLREQAGAWGIEEKVHFLGFLDRKSLYEQYGACSIVVCPNIWPEPFGRVPLEAGLAGKPVIAYDTGAVGETIVHDKTGLLIPPKDDAALADAIVKLLDLPEVAERMGSNARTHIAARHAAINPATQLMDAWRTILQA